ncbi:hypothetical protein LX81_03540 [Palleronia aestuarii]|uniref:Uncharacterized protein n=1 Tax=Palleronia aestuarii TaxID=568105 RepID=A0A2W7NH13_9RHOB|nr:hypothetical protein [Palleronia aestuarii]PZX12436.1 hypothetical protein LX81_03540 [Palleronia aestuarii]
MATENLKLRVKAGEKEGKNYWDTCGVLFINRNDGGEITSIQVRHNMFPGVEMVAFPKKDEPVTE